MAENLEEYNLDDHFIFFPAGGAFNKLRANSPNSQYLDRLLDECLTAGYSTSRSKRTFVEEKILSRIPGNLKIWKGKTPLEGRLVTMNDDEAYEKITQVLRDRKKYRKYYASPSSVPAELIFRPNRRAVKTANKSPPKISTLSPKKRAPRPSSKLQSSRRGVKKTAKTAVAAAAASTSADTHAIDTLKDQLIWSQKQELESLRRDFERQKEKIALQQQQINTLEGNIFEALLTANNKIYLEQVVGTITQEHDRELQVEEEPDDEAIADYDDGEDDNDYDEQFM